MFAVLIRNIDRTFWVVSPSKKDCRWEIICQWNDWLQNLWWRITSTIRSSNHQGVFKLWQPSVCLDATLFCLWQKKPSAGTTILSRIINRDTRRLKFDDSSDEEAETVSRDPHDIYALQKERDFKPVPGMNGMYYKVIWSLPNKWVRDKGRENVHYLTLNRIWVLR